jgi:HAD superfamily hydrolase (TIGR01484 family)
VLATDLDGTFLGGDDQQRRALYRRLDDVSDRTVLIFVTGRDLGFVADLCEDPEVPTPDLVIGDVGTTVVDGRTHAPVTAIQADIDRAWRDAAAQVERLLDGEPGLRPQPVVGGNRVSYHYDPEVLRPEAVARVEQAGFDVVRSASCYLDVLPRGVAKGSTLERVLAAFDLPRDRTLVAGDTLNDRSLFTTGLRGVVVGNAEPGLVRAVADLPAIHHSPAPGCAGITDAIAHFDLLPDTDDASDAAGTTTTSGTTDTIDTTERSTTR